MTEFVLVSCSKSKLDGTHRAEDLYDPSSVFRKRRTLGRRADAWGILSAKFGFLRPWEAIPDYDVHISDRTPVWGAFVLHDLLPALEHYGADTVTIYAGHGYVDPLVVELETHGYDVVDPHRGMMSGQRESKLKELVKPGEQTTLVRADGGRNSWYVDTGTDHSGGEHDAE